MLKKWMIISTLLPIILVGCSNDDDQAQIANDHSSLDTSIEASDDLAKENNVEDKEVSDNEVANEISNEEATDSEAAVYEGNSDDSQANVADSGSSNMPPRNDVDKPIKEITTASTVEMTAKVDYTLKNNDLSFVFTVTNPSENFFTFHFKNSQQYDYMIFDEDGNVVNEFSSEISQMPMQQPIKPGAQISYNVDVKDLPKGKYTATFVLKAEEMQPKAGVSFEIK